LAGPAGVLLTEVRATKQMGATHFTLVDAGFNDLVRASMYGAYHAMTLLPSSDGARTTRSTVIAGPLCESGDVFTQTSSGELAPRELPAAQVGDLLVFHDAGAYGASMSSNYNSRPLAPEVLVDSESVKLIRRRQTIDDLLQLENV
jgi:diaminopimelate decarboxylase